MNGLDQLYATSEAASARLVRNGREKELLRWATAFALGAAIFWMLPRIYEPTYVVPDALDSKTMVHYRRQWFGQTIETRLEARIDQELGTWVWMHKLPDGSWWRFYRESD